MFSCFECNAPAHHNHHIIPKVLGGTATVPLCESCHGKIHDIDFTRHSELVRIGIQKAKESGKQIGPKKKLSDDEHHILFCMWESGFSPQDLALRFHISLPTVRNYLKKHPGT